jgi:hypothetical protein
MRLFLIAAVVCAFALTVAGAFAARNPSGTGPPSQTCGSSTAPNTPGHSSSSPGSPFNPNGNAGTRYSPKSQYDVACYQTSQH